MSEACILYDRGYVCEVNVDLVMSCDDLCDGDNIVLEHFICKSIGLTHCELLAVGKKVLVGDNDESVNVLEHCSDTLFSLFHLLGAFKLEGLGN